MTERVLCVVCNKLRSQATRFEIGWVCKSTVECREVHAKLEENE